MKGLAKPKNTGKVIRRLLEYIGSFRGLLVVVFGAVVVSAGASVACDSLLKPAINNYILPLLTRAKNGESIALADYLPFLRLIVVMALIFACGAFASWLNSRLMLHISTQTLYRIRTDLFHELEKLPLRFYDSHTHGELMSLFTNDIDKCLVLIRTFLGKIPSRLSQHREDYFQTILYSVFKMCGANIRCEVEVSAGKLDILMQTSTTTYIMELKYDKSPNEALKQIDSKNYPFAYTDSNQKIVKVGINFSLKLGTLMEWKIVE